MKIYSYTSNADWETILKRPALDSSKLESIVSEVLARVKQERDAALKDYTARFDGVELKNLQVNKLEIVEARKRVNSDLQQAIQTAHQNIKTFHEQQQTAPQIIETMPGIQCWRKSVGIEKVGLYIPGGTAPLFSTILMLGVPAKIA
ncbi:MAG: histidinol dehydrogenase, partial [Bacteroidota bacterium]